VFASVVEMNLATLVYSIACTLRLLSCYYVLQNGRTALHWACQNGNIEIVRLLLTCWCFTSINARDDVILHNCLAVT
jgi:ankyrin repeat protein